MTARPALALVAAAAGLALAACGGDFPSNPVDAPSGNDAAGCQVVVQFTPASPVAPATVTARSDVFGSLGVVTYGWTVRRGGSDVVFTPLDASSRDIEFMAAQAGVYDVVLDVGAGCQPFYGQLNVQAPGANTRAVRLRFVPAPSMMVPPQEQVVTIAGGADYAAGVIALSPGQSFPLTVRGPSNQPVQAYLRFTSRADTDVVIEGFSDTAGAAAVRLVSGLYDVLVVPTSPAIAPGVITSFDPLTGALTLDAGRTLTGLVLASGSAPVVGARVSVMSGATPSTVATTAADGSYTLQWRDDTTAAETLTVVPPPTGDLPRIDAAVNLAAVSQANVHYAALATRDLTGVVVRVAGAAVADAQVTLHASVAVAATVLDGTTPLATVGGTYRRAVRTDATGHLPLVRVAQVTGTMYAGSGNGGAATVDLGNAATFDLARTTVIGRVLGSDGLPVAGATLRAVIAGDLAFPGAPAPAITAGSDGRFTVALAAGAPYDLAVVDPSADDAELDLDVTGTGTLDLGDLHLRSALAVSGEVRSTGQSVGLSAVGVAALCHLDCTGIDRWRPLGSAVTDGAGKFVVAVPDPGVGN